MSDQIDTADVVRHIPTGEEWIVACVRDHRLSWCGWPEGMAELKDCELIEKATPEKRDKLLREWATPGDHEKNRDHRHLYADARLTKEEKATK